MKKVDFGYVAKWYGGLAAGILLLLAAAWAASNIYVAFISILIAVAAVILIPKILDKNLQKSAGAVEATFPQTGFTYQYRFTSNTGVFYIDTTGRLGMLWKHNPKQLYFASLAGLQNVRVHDGKQLGGTALVSCRFTLDGQQFKIYTLRVSNGSLPMNSPDVQEAIAKANTLCQMLTLGQQNALQGAQ